MKKLIIAFVLAVCFIGAGNAQVSKKTIGVRFGNGAELSYQHPLGAAHRVELDLGFNSNVFVLAGIYHWVWELSDLADGVNWYAGGGGVVGIYGSSFALGVVGQVGIEYNFEKIPLLLSLDYRPGIYIIPFAPSYDGICLGARYKF